MARMIDADELKRRMCDLCNREYSDEPCDPSDCVFIRAIDETPTLTQPNEWVRVEDRLPGDSEGAVLLTNEKTVITGYRNQLFGLDGQHGIFAPASKKGGGYMQVTHWMPLPKPPKENSHD